MNYPPYQPPNLVLSSSDSMEHHGSSTDDDASSCFDNASSCFDDDATIAGPARTNRSTKRIVISDDTDGRAQPKPTSSKQQQRQTPRSLEKPAKQQTARSAEKPAKQRAPRSAEKSASHQAAVSQSLPRSSTRPSGEKSRHELAADKYWKLVNLPFKIQFGDAAPKPAISTLTAIDGTPLGSLEKERAGSNQKRVEIPTPDLLATTLGKQRLTEDVPPLPRAHLKFDESRLDNVHNNYHRTMKWWPAYYEDMENINPDPRYYQRLNEKLYVDRVRRNLRKSRDVFKGGRT